MKKNRLYNFRCIYITPILLLLLLFGCGTYVDGELVHVGIRSPIDERKWNRYNAPKSLKGIKSLQEQKSSTGKDECDDLLAQATRARMNINTRTDLYFGNRGDFYYKNSNDEIILVRKDPYSDVGCRIEHLGKPGKRYKVGSCITERIEGKLFEYEKRGSIIEYELVYGDQIKKYERSFNCRGDYWGNVEEITLGERYFPRIQR